MRKKPTPDSWPIRQRGAALLIALLIVGLGLVSLLTLRGKHKGMQMELEQRTTQALAEAKDALLGAAMTDNDGDNPGRVLCPDQDNDGEAQGAACGLTPSGGLVAIGRIPNKTLNLSDVRDQANERIWYILDKQFRSQNQPFNSQLLPQLTFNGQAVVAVLIAPGIALASQNRPAEGGNVYTAYLEGFDEGAGTYTAAAPSAAYNDQTLTITAAELYSRLTMRMARELSFTAYDGDGMVTGMTIATLTKPSVWSVNEWDNAVDDMVSKVAANTVTVKFLNCGTVYTLSARGVVQRSAAGC